MKKILLSVCFILLLSTCNSLLSEKNSISNDRNQYVNYLNEFWNSGCLSYVDSALIYNAYVLESDSANILDYQYRIQMLDLCGRYNSIISVVNSIPQNMVSWPPKYKSYLRLKCKAKMAKESNDIFYYNNCLDSILVIWSPILQDSISKTDSLLVMPMDQILERHGHLLFTYSLYYEIVSLRYGKDSVEQILSSKKEMYNWNEETYDMITENDVELSLP